MDPEQVFMLGTSDVTVGRNWSDGLRDSDNRILFQQVLPPLSWCIALRWLEICFASWPVLGQWGLYFLLRCLINSFYGCLLPIYDHPNLYFWIMRLGFRFWSNALAAQVYTSDLELPKVNTHRFGTKQNTDTFQHFSVLAPCWHCWTRKRETDTGFRILLGFPSDTFKNSMNSTHLIF